MSEHDQLRALVEAKAHLAGIPPPQVRIRRRHPGQATASRHGATGRTTFAERLCHAPANVQEYTVAHEIAHLALGHPFRPARLMMLTLALVTIGALIVLATAVAGFPHPLTWQGPATSVLSMVLLATYLIAAAPMRQREHAADAYAAIRLHAPLTDEIAAWRPRADRFAWAITPEWASTHPTWANRVDHVKRFLGDPR